MGFFSFSFYFFPQKINRKKRVKLHLISQTFDSAIYLPRIKFSCAVKAKVYQIVNKRDGFHTLVVSPIAAQWEITVIRLNDFARSAYLSPAHTSVDLRLRSDLNDRLARELMAETQD